MAYESETDNQEYREVEITFEKEKNRVIPWPRLVQNPSSSGVLEGIVPQWYDRKWTEFPGS